MRGLRLLSFVAPLVALLCRSVIAVPVDDGDEWVPIRKDRRLTKRGKSTVTVFEHAATQSRIEYVSDSGICETTKGVKQHSGYFSVGEGMNMWFWFFEARKNATNAPLVSWFNGGAQCHLRSAMRLACSY
jgi:carboxypeptidase C (cathepsin A)